MCFQLQVFAGNDSDAESPKDIQSLANAVKSTKISQAQHSGNGLANSNRENLLVEKDTSSVLHVHDSTLSVGEILSSLDTGISSPVHVNDLCVDKHPTKVNGSVNPVKRSNFWGRNSVSF